MCDLCTSQTINKTHRQSGPSDKNTVCAGTSPPGPAQSGCSPVTGRTPHTTLPCPPPLASRRVPSGMQGTGTRPEGWRAGVGARAVQGFASPCQAAGWRWPTPRRPRLSWLLPGSPAAVSGWLEHLTAVAPQGKPVPDCRGRPPCPSAACPPRAFSTCGSSVCPFDA